MRLQTNFATLKSIFFFVGIEELKCFLLIISVIDCCFRGITLIGTNTVGNYGFYVKTIELVDAMPTTPLTNCVPKTSTIMESAKQCNSTTLWK